jgi:hypothetical protein
VISVAFEVDRLVLKTMPLGFLNAQILGGKAACLSQRVADKVSGFVGTSATVSDVALKILFW